MIVTSLKKEYLNDLEKAVKSVIQESNMVHKQQESEYYLEVYADYRDEFPESYIKDIVNTEKQCLAMAVFEESVEQMYFEEGAGLLEELVDDISGDQRVVDIWEKLCKADRSFRNKNLNEYISDIVQEFVYVRYPEDDMLRQEVNVYIPIDCGNANYDFACDNILNYCGEQKFAIQSSVLWLAKQQGKEIELRKVVEDYEHGYYENGEYVSRKTEKNEFVESMVCEMENLSSSLATMIFLLKLSIKDLIKLVELRNRENQEGYIVLDKNTVCGLYDMWNGGGSCLDVKLEQDVTIPFKNIYDVCVDGIRQHGYDPDEVYGLYGECWKDALKEVHAN